MFDDTLEGGEASNTQHSEGRKKEARAAPQTQAHDGRGPSVGPAARGGRGPGSSKGASDSGTETAQGTPRTTTGTPAWVSRRPAGGPAWCVSGRVSHRNRPTRPRSPLEGRRRWESGSAEAAPRCVVAAVPPRRTPLGGAPVRNGSRAWLSPVPPPRRGTGEENGPALCPS